MYIKHLDLYLHLPFWQLLLFHHRNNRGHNYFYRFLLLYYTPFFIFITVRGEWGLPADTIKGQLNRGRAADRFNLAPNRKKQRGCGRDYIRLALFIFNSFLFSAQKSTFSLNKWNAKFVYISPSPFSSCLNSGSDRGTSAEEEGIVACNPSLPL